MKNLVRTFYGKLSLLLLLVLLTLAIAQIFITLGAIKYYMAEVDQRLNVDLAKNMAAELKPFLAPQPEMDQIGHSIHYMMVMNPQVEIYLLDQTGKILAFFAEPGKKPVAQNVDLDPVHRYLDSGQSRLVLGFDPRNPGAQKPFSVAPLTLGNDEPGYLYIIIGGQDYDSLSAVLRESYIGKTMLIGILISIMLTGMIGMSLFALLTRRLQKMSRSVQDFEKGDYDVRLPEKPADEIGQLGHAFNRMADRLVSILEELKRTDDLRRELVANVSHDLRTPLTSIQGYLETIIMKDANLSAEERLRYLEIMFKDTDHLNKMVHDLFELSKLDAMQIKPKPEPFSLAELTQDIAIKFKVKADKCHIDLNANVQHNLPQVRADIGMIERALSNLIDNAIDYTPEEGRVSINLERIDGKIRASVVDTGCGISNDDLEHIFDRFYQGQKKGLRGKGGTGLGLAIAKKILELHKSTLYVESVVDQGTNFFFDLECYA